MAPTCIPRYYRRSAIKKMFEDAETTPGPPGPDGNTPYVQGGTWWIDGVDTGFVAIGEDGADGQDGEQGIQGPVGEGVPVGGSTGQVLAKASAANHDTEWVDQSGGVNGRVLAASGGFALTSAFSTTSTSFVNVKTGTTPALLSGDLLEVFALGAFYHVWAGSETHAYFRLLIDGVAYILPASYFSLSSNSANKSVVNAITRRVFVNGLTGAKSLNFQARSRFGDTVLCNANGNISYVCELIYLIWR